MDEPARFTIAGTTHEHPALHHFSKLLPGTLRECSDVERHADLALLLECAGVRKDRREEGLIFVSCVLVQRLEWD